MQVLLCYLLLLFCSQPFARWDAPWITGKLGERLANHTINLLLRNIAPHTWASIRARTSTSGQLRRKSGHLLTHLPHLRGHTFYLGAKLRGFCRRIKLRLAESDQGKNKTHRAGSNGHC